MKIKKIPFEILLLVVILALHAYIAFSPESRLLNIFQTDDAFYYFVTARNIAEGKGITFDGISATNGFHPLWMLICVPIFSLANVNVFLPLRIVIMVMAILNAGTGILLYRFFAKKFSKEAGWLVSIFWTFLPTIHQLTSELGLESGLTAFALVAAVSYVSSFEDREIKPKNYLVMSLLGTFLLFSRLDTIFLVVMMGIWLVFRKTDLRWQILLDGLFAFLSAIIAYYLRVQNTDNIFNFLPFLYIFIVLSLLTKVIFQYVFKGYACDSSVSLKKQIIRVILGSVVSTVITGGLIFILHDILRVFLGFPRAVLLIDFAISLFFMLGWRIGYILYMHWKKRDYTSDISWSTNGKKWVLNAAAYFAPILALLAGYLLFNKAYSGSYMPISGTIKRWWGTLPLTVYGQPLKTLGDVMGSWFTATVKDGPWWLITAPVGLLVDVATQLTGIQEDTLAYSNFQRDFGMLIWVFVIFGILYLIYRKKGFIQKAVRETAFLPLFVGCVFHLFSYKATGYLHAKYWYWIPEILCVVIFIGIILESVLQRYKRYLHGTFFSQMLVSIFCVVLVLNLAVPMIKRYSYIESDVSDHQYIKEVKYVEDHTKPGDIIGMTGGGVIAYFIQDRTIVNLDGLINGTEYYEQLKEARAYEYLDEIGLDYVYAAKPMILESDPYGWIFQHRLIFMGKRGEFEFYRYIQGVETPDVHPQ